MTNATETTSDVRVVQDADRRDSLMTADHNMRLRLVGYIDRLRAQHGDEAAGEVERFWQPVAVEVERLAVERERIAADQTLSALGRSQRRAEVTAKVNAIVDRVREHATRIEADLVETENRVLRLVPAGSGGYVEAPRRTEPPSVETVMARHEIRTALRAMTPLQVEGAYLTAVEAANDEALVDAVETAPRVAGLVSDEVIAKARAIRLRKSDHGPLMTRRRAVVAVHQALADGLGREA